MKRVNDIDSLRAAVASGDAVRFVHFWGHRIDPRGIGPTCMSQWYPAGFVADGIQYPTAEHWMMAGKARLFGDEEMLQRILSATTPKQAKSLGRKVRGFDSATWDAHRVPIVVEGNIHKFSGNPTLRRFLLGTGDAVLVEASPYDRIWGIGLSASAPGADDPAAWRGLNLLGFALMDVREALLHDSEAADAP